MKMYDMTKNDIAIILKHDKNLRYMGLERKLKVKYGPYDNIRETTLYSNEDLFLSYLYNFILKIKQAYKDTFKDATEVEADLLLNSIFAKRLCLQDTCIKVLFNNFQNNYLFNDPNFKIEGINSGADLNQSFMVRAKVTNSKLKNIYIEVSLPSTHDGLIKDLKIYSNNFNDQITRILTNFKVNIQIGFDYIGYNFYDIYLKDLKSLIEKEILLYEKTGKSSGMIDPNWE